MTPFPNKDNSPDFSPNSAYIQDIHSSRELIQKELDVIREEQSLLQKRIQLTASLINDLPSYDPQYAMLLTQTKMDQIELDELKVREGYLIQRFDSV
jgi:hypothetical protein